MRKRKRYTRKNWPASVELKGGGGKARGEVGVWNGKAGERHGVGQKSGTEGRMGVKARARESAVRN